VSEPLGEETLPRVLGGGTRGRGLLPPSARVRHSGKRLASPRIRERHSGESVFKISPFSHIIYRLRVPLFPECHGLLGTRGSLSSTSATLEEKFLPRVSDIWHSGNPLTLGEFPFSHSVISTPSVLKNLTFRTRFRSNIRNLNHQ
jgi:hypothetical protein